MISTKYIKEIESDIKDICKEYSIYSFQNFNNDTENMFMITGQEKSYDVFSNHYELNYRDITGLEISITNRDNVMRVDITHRSKFNSHSFFFINDKIEYTAMRKYIAELVSNSYNYLCSLKSSLNMVGDSYGVFPKELNVYSREDSINKILGE